MFTLIFVTITLHLNKFDSFDWNYSKISRNALNCLNITFLKDIWQILKTIDFIKDLLGGCFLLANPLYYFVDVLFEMEEKP